MTVNELTSEEIRDAYLAVSAAIRDKPNVELTETEVELISQLRKAFNHLLGQHHDGGES